MGTVYVGRLLGAHGFDRLVAVKCIRGFEGSPQSLEAFLREARVAAKIHHANVVQTFELDEDAGTPFMVMELVRGVALDRLDRLERRLREAGKPLACELAAWIIAQAATGLHAAHELTSDDGEPLGLVHRDMSPQNILLSFDGRVYVADFGVAKHDDDGVTTQSGVVKGKFAYMSPEQARASMLDRRSDVFALGVILYEALTQQKPFLSGSPSDTLLRLVERDPEDPRALRPEIPDRLAAIVLRCLEKDPKRRHATAEELAIDLRAFTRSRAPIDESDLGTLLAQTCGVERDALDERLRATGRARSSRVTPAATMRLPNDETPGSVVSPAPGRPLRTLLSIGVAAALAAGLLVLAIPRKSNAPPRTDVPTVVETSAVSSAPSRVEEPSGAPATVAGPTPTPQASASATATASVAPKRKSPAAASAGAATPPAPSAPAPSVTQAAGRPFSEL